MAAAATEIDVPFLYIVGKATEMFQRVFKPGQPFEATEDDPGFVACVKSCVDLEGESMDQEITVSLDDQARQFREIYRLTHNMSVDTEPADGEMKAWKATARFVILAVQADGEDDASAVFDAILVREQETADASAD